MKQALLIPPLLLFAPLALGCTVEAGGGLDATLAALERTRTSHVGDSRLELAASLGVRLERLGEVRDHLAADPDGPSGEDLERIDARRAELAEDLLELRRRGEASGDWRPAGDDLLRRLYELEEELLRWVEAVRS